MNNKIIDKILNKLLLEYILLWDMDIEQDAYPTDYGVDI